MKTNVGTIDRAARIVIGLVLIVPPQDVAKAVETLSEATIIGETFAWDGDTQRVLI